MARSQLEPACSRPGLDLVSADDERDPRLCRQDESGSKAREKRLCGGKNPGILTLIFSNPQDLTATVYSVLAGSNFIPSGPSPHDRPTTPVLVVTLTRSP